LNISAATGNTILRSISLGIDLSAELHYTLKIRAVMGGNFQHRGTLYGNQTDRYLNQLLSYQWGGQVKVITGIRRCGKSYLLRTLF